MKIIIIFTLRWKSSISLAKYYTTSRAVNTQRLLAKLLYFFHPEVCFNSDQSRSEKLISSCFSATISHRYANDVTLYAEIKRVLLNENICSFCTLERTLRTLRALAVSRSFRVAIEFGGLLSARRVAACRGKLPRSLSARVATADAESTSGKVNFTASIDYHRCTVLSNIPRSLCRRFRWQTAK